MLVPRVIQSRPPLECLTMMTYRYIWGLSIFLLIEVLNNSLKSFFPSFFPLLVYVLHTVLLIYSPWIYKLIVKLLYEILLIELWVLWPLSLDIYVQSLSMTNFLFSFKVNLMLFSGTFLMIFLLFEYVYFAGENA